VQAAPETGAKRDRSSRPGAWSGETERWRADRLPGPTSGGIPVQPDLDRRHQSGECARRAAAAGAP
jgi:hypothetical protein